MFAQNIFGEMDLRRVQVAAALLCALVSGCAAPDKPGSGVGFRYTPVIDTAQSDMSRYPEDLADCRRLASDVDGLGEMLLNGLAGALVGASIGSRYGLGGRYREDVAATGSGAAIGATAAKYEARQERVMINCMATRGYRVLDAGTVVQVNQQPRPITSTEGGATLQPAAASQPTVSQPVAVATASPPAPLAGAPSLAPKYAIGQWSLVVERLPAARACSAEPRASITAKGPGVETYTVPCNNGDILTVRCDMGICRPLR